MTYAQTASFDWKLAEKIGDFVRAVKDDIARSRFGNVALEIVISDAEKLMGFCSYVTGYKVDFSMFRGYIND